MTSQGGSFSAEVEYEGEVSEGGFFSPGTGAFAPTVGPTGKSIGFVYASDDK